MYYPYLYGRAAELLALRDVAGALGSWNVLPIIEPTKVNPDSLKRCLSKLKTESARVAVVANPAHGEFKDSTPASWWSAMKPFFDDHRAVVSAFQISRPVDASNLTAFLASQVGEDVVIIVRSADLSPAALASALHGSKPTILLHGSCNPANFLPHLGAFGTSVVANSFNVQPRNADYSGEEWFSGPHVSGSVLSDFTLLPNSFSDSGGQAAAVAVHLSFVKPDGNVWVEHFVSDSVIVGDGTATSKLGEAVDKVASTVASNPSKFLKTKGLEVFLAQHKSGIHTNLMGNKRQQIAHHLETVASIV